MEISFHIPNSNTQFVGDENRPPAQVGVSSCFAVKFYGLLIVIFHWCLVQQLCVLGFPWQNYVNGRCWCWRRRSCVYLWGHCNSHAKVGVVGCDRSTHTQTNDHALSICLCLHVNFTSSSSTLYVSFSMANINIHFCRGRYNVELHLSFLRLQGQANDFKIQYSSVVRLFLLPKVFFLGLIFKGAD